MAKYHKYVFDAKRRKFIGDFEKMYTAEVDSFDSWHQTDKRNISKQFCSRILNEYNFNTIIDVGCGKGSFTHTLKKKNNYVAGLDVSQTAIKTAKSYYPDVEFFQFDVESKDFENNINNIVDSKPIDLIVCNELLSYIRNWSRLIKHFSKLAGFCLISVGPIPVNPIGFVKSIDDLVEAFDNNFDLIYDIRLVKHEAVILFGKIKKEL